MEVQKMRFKPRDAIFVAAIVMTVALAWRWNPGETKQAQFRTTASFLVLAEAMLWGYPFRRRQPPLPLLPTGLLTVAPWYFCGVVALGLVAIFSTLNVAMLLGIQLFWLVWIVGIGTALTAIGRGGADDVPAASPPRQSEERFYPPFHQLNNRVQQLGYPGLNALKIRMNRQDEAMRGQSPVAREETAALLAELQVLVTELEDNAVDADIGTLSESIVLRLQRLEKR